MDWDVDVLEKYISFTNGKAHEAFVSENGKYVLVTSKFISTDGRSARYTDANLAPANKNDLLMVLSDVPNGRAIAKCFLAPENDTYTVNQRIGIIKPKDLFPKWLYYILDRNPYYLSFDDGVKQTNLRKLDVLSCKVPILPRNEQEAIANALSDADALIESLEKLIAKKRLIKKGAMQELLHPKETWVETSINEICDNRKDLFDDGDWVESEHITDRGVRLIQTGNIGTGKFIEKGDKKYIYERSFTSLGCKLIKPGDLLICRLAEPAGRACVFPVIAEDRVITSVDVSICRPPSEKVDRRFLSNLFSTPDWLRHVSDRSGGTTHKRIARGSLGKIKFKIPSLQEQIQIADVLSDIDSEILAHESRLQKVRLIKQGMMKELLTGRIRLI